MAVARAALGEETYEKTLDACHASIQCLDVLAQAGQIAADVGKVSTNFGSEALDVGSEIFTQALDFRPNFGAKGAEATTHVVPVRQYERSQNRAYDDGCDEFR